MTANIYDYRQAVYEDVLQAINENYTKEELLERLDDRDGWEQDLRDDLWIDDSVTGNASGSYTFSAWKAEENLCHNWNLMCEVAEEFGIEPTVSTSSWDHGPEWWDVSIRCYLLSEAIARVLDDLEETAGSEN